MFATANIISNNALHASLCLSFKHHDSSNFHHSLYLPELPEFRLNLNKRYQLRCVPNRPIIINPLSYRTKQLNRHLVAFIPAFINLLINDFYDFNFFDFKKTVLSNLDSMTTKFCRHFSWFYFAKYNFYFLIQTPGIRMAILSVYQV